MLRTLNVKRITQITRVLFKYGFYQFIHNIGLLKYLPLHKRFKLESNDFIDPVTLRNIFEELGGAFIKLGQLLALRPDLIGKKYSKELEKLLQENDHADFEYISKKLSKLKFDTISKVPLGSGSIAQVHFAKKGNRKFAIKVKKPNIDKIFNDDIRIMEYISRKVSNHYNFSFVDINDIVEEFKRYTNKELNFFHEALNMEKFGKNFSDSENIKIPKVYKDLSDSDILVMEYVEGKNIMDFIGDKNRGKLNVIDTIADSVYKMIFEDRFFHADLHPGNIFFNKDKIIYLDFGIVGRIDDELEKKIFYLFSSLVEADLEGTTDALLQLNIGDVEPEIRVLKQGIEDVLGDYYNSEIKDMDFEKIFYDSIEVARRSKIKMPASLVLFGKSLITMEGFCREVDPHFNVVSHAKPYVNKIIKQELSISNVKKESKLFLKEFYFEFRKFPKYVKDFYRKFDIIERQITGIDENMTKFTVVFKDMVKLMVLTILFSTFFFSAVLLKEFGPMIYDMPIFSSLLLFLSLVVFVRLVSYFLRKF